MIVIKIFLAGIMVLIVAIGMNLAAKGLGLATWYDFLNIVSETGLRLSFQELNFFDYLFLIFIYPVALGAAAYFIFQLTRHF